MSFYNGKLVSIFQDIHDKLSTSGYYGYDPHTVQTAREILKIVAEFIKKIGELQTSHLRDFKEKNNGLAKKYCERTMLFISALVYAKKK